MDRSARPPGRPPPSPGRLPSPVPVSGVPARPRRAVRRPADRDSDDRYVLAPVLRDGPAAVPDGVLGPRPVEALQRIAGNAATGTLLAAARRPHVARLVIQRQGGHPTLREGSHGPAVQELQEKLGRVLATGGPVTTDGQFGPSTRTAVLTFQRGLPAVPDTGVADAATWTALDAAVAALPAPVRPVLSFGSSGPDVGLAQQKLNGSGAATPPLAVNATFDVATWVAVIAFQYLRSIPITGSVDARTWTTLDAAVPGGGTRLEGGAPVEGNVNAATAASPTAPAVAGTSLHPVVGPGGITRGLAVKEFQQKLNVWLAARSLRALVDDGIWGTRTQTVTAAFQTASGVPASGIGDIPTWTALDAVAPVVAVGFENRQWNEEVGGHTYSMLDTATGNASRYGWEVRRTEMHVSAAVNFVGGSPPSAWFAHVRRAWNRYKAVKTGTTESLRINFEMTRGSGAEANTVQVSPGTGRANAGQWFLGDTRAASTIPHEFGHLIGLRDEYQLHAADFRTITGHEPFVGQDTAPPGQTPQTIAAALQAAMLARNSANARTATAGLTQGAFAQRVVAAYAALPAATVPAVVGPPAQLAIPLAGNLVRDLDQALPNDPPAGPFDKYNTIEALTYDSGSIMGDPARHPDPHDHGAQPRHLQEFADILGRVRGGAWQVVLR